MTSPPDDAARPLGAGTGDDDDGDDDAAADALWQSVYAAREAYYREQFGEIPDDILKMANLFGVWPGGGLFVMRAGRLGEDAWAYSTFGLTNPDMPATTTVADADVERDDEGRVGQTSFSLRAKEPADAPKGVAGYGYEMLVLTREQAEWPLWFLQWAVNAEILNDVGILERVEKHGGFTVEEIQVGEDDDVNVLIAKAHPPLPTGTTLPNGRMNLLVATVISENEMQWSMQHGRDALLTRLQQAGVGQFSVRGRRSVEGL